MALRLSVLSLHSALFTLHSALCTLHSALCTLQSFEGLCGCYCVIIICNVAAALAEGYNQSPECMSQDRSPRMTSKLCGLSTGMHKHALGQIIADSSLQR